MAGSRSGGGASRITTVQALAVASQFGVTLAVSVGVGLFAGQWLDGQLHTSFVFTLIGVLLGLVLAASSTVRMYRAVLRRSASDERGAETEAEGSAEYKTEP